MWRGLRVKDLIPAPALNEDFPVSQQQSVIDDLKRDPLGAHSFIGPSGVGKSRFLYCLLHEAIEEGCRHIFFSKMASLIRSLRDNEFKQLPEERWHEIITPDDLEDCEKEPMHIFIDEFDKIPLTDDIYLRIFELVDFVYEHQNKAVLCICSNLALNNFTAIWGEGMLRRIGTVSKLHELWRV